VGESGFLYAFLKILLEVCIGKGTLVKVQFHTKVQFHYNTDSLVQSQLRGITKLKPFFKLVLLVIQVGS